MGDGTGKREKVEEGRGEVKGEGAKNKLNSKDKFVLVFKVRERRPLSSFSNLQQCKTHQKKKK